MAPVRAQLPERYEQVELVARGGMGDVLRARDAHLDRLVAIKLLRVDPAGPESVETRRARFTREARAVAQLDHPSIVTVYDIGEAEDGTPYMTMRWLEGGTLPMSRDAATTAEQLRWLAQVAGALDAAHHAGVVHRDVKPGNVLLDAERNAYIGDFGIALLEDDAAAGLTTAGAVIGTATYMSPEQATGSPAVAASDQYALALIAYELLAGNRPFQRSSAIAELAAQASERPPHPSLVRPDLPPSIDPVFDRALAKDPLDRFPSCTEFVAVLEHALLDMAPPTIPAPVRAHEGARRRPRDRSRLVPVAVLGALLLIAIIAGFAVADGPPAQQPGASTDDTPARTTQERTTPTTTEQEQQPTEPEPEPEPEPTADTQPSPDSGLSRDEAIALHEQAYRELQAGDFATALANSQRALAALGGVEPYEAFANFNVGASLAGLGRCEEAMPYLDRSQQLQGERREIDAVRRACGGSGTGNGQGRGEDDDEGDDDD